MLWWDFTIDHWRIVLVSPVSNEEGVELLILCPTRGKVQSQCHAASAVKINKLRSSRWKGIGQLVKTNLAKLFVRLLSLLLFVHGLCRFAAYQTIQRVRREKERESEGSGGTFRWDVPVGRSSHWNLFMCFLGMYIFDILLYYMYVSISAYIYIYIYVCVCVCMYVILYFLIINMYVMWCHVR